LDSEAPQSFAAVRPDGTRWNVLLGDCITAERNARTLPDIVAAAAQDRDKVKAAGKRVEWLASFFGVAGHRPDPVGEAINVLRSEVYIARLNAERVLAERSRKTDENAQRSAGISWIKESVLRLSGKKQHEHVRVLAEAALGAAHLTIGSVRKAATPSDALRSGYSTAKQRSTHSSKKEPPNGPPAPS
jgi:hypothetical protein